MPICTDMLSVIDDPPPGLQPGVGKGYASTSFLDPRLREDDSEDEEPSVGLHEPTEEEDNDDGSESEDEEVSNVAALLEKAEMRSVGRVYDHGSWYQPPETMLMHFSC